MVPLHMILRFEESKHSSSSPLFWSKAYCIRFSWRLIICYECSFVRFGVNLGKVWILLLAVCCSCKSKAESSLPKL